MAVKEGRPSPQHVRSQSSQVRSGPWNYWESVTRHLAPGTLCGWLSSSLTWLTNWTSSNGTQYRPVSKTHEHVSRYRGMNNRAVASWRECGETADLSPLSLPPSAQKSFWQRSSCSSDTKEMQSRTKQVDHLFLRIGSQCANLDRSTLSISWPPQFPYSAASRYVQSSFR